MVYTTLIMSSGRTYTIEKHPEDVITKLTNDFGILINGFVEIDGLVINPTHIESIEANQIKE
jgi:uncharacterized protein YlzI (FlbEa/FlbD family)